MPKKRTVKRSKRLKNEWRDRPPNVKEVRDAQKLAAKVSRNLLEMMEAKTVE